MYFLSNLQFRQTQPASSPPDAWVLSREWLEGLGVGWAFLSLSSYGLKALYVVVSCVLSSMVASRRADSLHGHQLPCSKQPQRSDIGCKAAHDSLGSPRTSPPLHAICHVSHKAEPRYNRQDMDATAPWEESKERLDHLQSTRWSSLWRLNHMPHR